MIAHSEASGLPHIPIYKVGYVESTEREFRFARVFAHADRNGTPLLEVATDGSQVDLLKTLIERMPEPFWLLYVLRVPRGEGEAGRYRSAEAFLRTDVNAFLDQFRNYLESDARHNFWIKSLEGPSLLVLDEHNLIYCYGPTHDWASELEHTGWREGREEELVLPDTHLHNYHPIFGDDAKRMLGSLEWVHSSLQKQDA